MNQRLIGTILLMIGILCGIIILLQAHRKKELFAKENGKLPVLCALETAVYFCATLGVSDYLLNNLIVKNLRLTDDKRLPGTVIACGITPGAVIAFSLLQAENPVDFLTLLLCCAGITGGAAFGAFLVGKADGSRIKRVMRIALIGSLIALIIKIIVSQGAAGTLTGLSGGRLIAAIAFSIFWGAVNMLGIPGKPAGTAFFLIIGLSPLTTLTLVLVMACMGPMVGGGFSVLKSGYYHSKMAVAATIFGSIGAVLGVLFTISINANVLNVLLIIVMVIAIISMFRNDGQSQRCREGYRKCQNRRK